MNWNRRYVVYARAHGQTPEQMGSSDVQLWPGGRMTGYIVWIEERWSEYRALRGWIRQYPLSPADHAAFDAWLEASHGAA